MKKEQWTVVGLLVALLGLEVVRSPNVRGFFTGAWNNFQSALNNASNIIPGLPNIPGLPTLPGKIPTPSTPGKAGIPNTGNNIKNNAMPPSFPATGNNIKNNAMPPSFPATNGLKAGHQ